MLVAQITDTHIKPNGRLAYGNVLDSSSLLRRVVKHCNEFNSKIDIVIVTGDLTDSGQLEEYEEFNKIMKDLKIPWFLIQGIMMTKIHLWNFLININIYQEMKNFVIMLLTNILLS